MNGYDEKYEKDYGLEFYLLSCIVINPKLMEKVYLEDKYFVHYQRLWIFMKAFYNKFKTFDTKLMRNICPDRLKMSNYIQMMADCGPIHKPTDEEFNNYQERLIESYYESKKETWIIEKIFDLANRLYTRQINIAQFKKEEENIYINADKKFNEGEKTKNID